MAYQLYNARGEEILHPNLQDRGIWCNFGETKEAAFVTRYGDALSIKINPAKATDRYAPDLMSTDGNRLGDLKLQSTPFFKATSLYNLDPQWAVVFNLKDRERYSQLYPDIDIYFWVDWQSVRFSQGNTNIEVAPITGVWKIPFTHLEPILDNSPLHSYMQRRFDNQGNAKSSYVLDIRNTAFQRVA